MKQRPCTLVTLSITSLAGLCVVLVLLSTVNLTSLDDTPQVKQTALNVALEDVQPPCNGSPYECRMGKEILSWARKPDGLFAMPPPDQVGCFVHVGKTAGTTIGCLLGFPLHCDENKTEVAKSSRVAALTAFTWHINVNDCPLPSAFYLFPVRHPITRALSAYSYDRPHHDSTPSGHDRGRTALYIDCGLKTLEDLIQRGLSPSASASPECQQLAFKTVTGLERHGTHLYYNYEYHSRLLLVDPRPRVLVMRMEHLAQDWLSAEQALGGNVTAIDIPRLNSQSSHADERILSNESTAILCRVLCQEIRFYSNLLHRAENLSHEDVRSSLEELRATCPTEAVDC